MLWQGSRVPDVVRKPLVPALCTPLLWLLLMLGPSLFGTAMAAVWEDVTVVTLGGWEYRGVSLDVSSDSTFVELIDAGGGRKRLTNSNIRLVLDARGKDITAAVLAGEAPPIHTSDTADSSQVAEPMERIRTGPPVPATSGAGPHAAARSSSGIRAQGLRFRAMLTGGLGYGVPTGDWFEGMTSGLAIDFTGRIAVSSALYLGLAYKHQKLGVDEDYEGAMTLYDYYGSPYTVWIDMDVHLTEVYGLMGFYSDPMRDTQPFGYFEVGLGSIAHKVEATVSYEGMSESGDSSESKFGLLLAGGGTLPLNPTVGLTLEGSMRLTGSGDSNPYDYSDTGTSGFLFGIRFGATLLLGH